VSKTTNGATTTCVYNAFGNLAARGSSPGGTATCYVTWDHLGSTRMLTDNTGANNANLRRYDYLPFGQEIPSGVDGRTAGMGYTSTPDVTNPKFTGEYRDPETTLDWLAVRAMSGAQGRFQSVDPDSAGAAAGDPQTWNAYAYVGNNPLSYTDPSGLGFWSDLGNFLLNLGLDVLTQGGWSIGNIVGTVATGGSLGGDTIGGISGGVNDGPWNEQIPIGGVGAGVNTGGTFGSGSTGPGVFSFADQQWGDVNLSDYIHLWPIYSRRTGAKIRNLRYKAQVPPPDAGMFAISFAYFKPIPQLGYVPLGPQATFAGNRNTVCLSLGGGIGTPGKSINWGPVYTGGKPIASVMSGRSLSYNFQILPWLGQAGTYARGGAAVGPLFGTPGASVVGSYGVCSSK